MSETNQIEKTHIRRVSQSCDIKDEVHPSKIVRKVSSRRGMRIRALSSEDVRKLANIKKEELKNIRTRSSSESRKKLN